MLVGVFDTRRPSPGRVVAVEATLGTTRLSLTPLADGTWSSPASLAGSGEEPVTVTVHRAGLPDAVASYRWVVGGAPDQTRPAVVSTAPLRTPLELAAVGLGLLVAATAGWLVLMRRRRRAFDIKLSREYSSVPAPVPSCSGQTAEATRGRGSARSS